MIIQKWSLSAEIATFCRNYTFLLFLVFAEITETLSGAFSSQIFCRKPKERPFGRSLVVSHTCGHDRLVPVFLLSNSKPSIRRQLSLTGGNKVCSLLVCAPLLIIICGGISLKFQDNLCSRNVLYSFGKSVFIVPSTEAARTDRDHLPLLGGWWPHLLG